MIVVASDAASIRHELNQPRILCMHNIAAAAVAAAVFDMTKPYVFNLSSAVVQFKSS